MLEPPLPLDAPLEAEEALVGAGPPGVVAAVTVTVWLAETSPLVEEGAPSTATVLRAREGSGSPEAALI